MTRALFLFAAITTALLSAGCSDARPIAADAGKCDGIGATALAANLPSPYDIAGTWETDAGQTLRLSELRGKPRVLAMFFTTCEGTCLITVANLKQIEASLSPRQQTQIGFVLITLDPAHDTPRALAAYRHNNALSADHWTLLRGSPQATAQLASRLGLTFSRESSRGLVHSNGLALTDPTGRIIHQQLGLHPDLSRAVAAAKSVTDSPTAEVDSRSIAQNPPTTQPSTVPGR